MTINQFKLFATCAKGLEDILVSELLALGGADVKAGEGGASFKGDLALVYKANICLRTAVRVLFFSQKLLSIVMKPFTSLLPPLIGPTT